MVNWPHNPLPDALLAEFAAQVYPQTQGFVPGYGSLTPQLILVGEAPGATEVTSQRPFTGRAGVKLDLMLEALGLTRQAVFITMSFHRRPIKLKPNGRLGNRPPAAQELAQEAALLDQELAALPQVPILAMGTVALKRLGAGPLQAQHGQVRSVAVLSRSGHAWVPGPRRLVAACAHPAALLYRRATEVQTLADLAAIRTVLEEIVC